MGMDSTAQGVASSKTPRPGANVRGANGTPQQSTDVQTPRFDELVKSLRLQPAGNLSSARLRLQPPELGHLRVDVRVLGDRVRIDVQTETDAARDLLSRRAEQLKTGLENQGIRLERLEVVLNGASVPPAGPDAPQSPAVPARPADSDEPGREKRAGRHGSSAARTLVRDGLSAALDARLDVQV
jgi:hypothetical protein